VTAHLGLSPAWLACLDSRRMNAFHRYGTLHLVLGDRAWDVDRAHAALLGWHAEREAGAPDAPVPEEAQAWFERRFEPDREAWRLRDDTYFAPTPSILDDDLAILFFARDGSRQLRVKVGADGLAFFGRLLPALREGVDADALRADLGEGPWRMVASLLAQGVVVERAPAHPGPTALEVKLVAHSCVRVATPTTRLVVDPMLIVRARPDFDPFPALDGPVHAALITHAHWDHFTLDGLLHLRRDTPILLPERKHPASIVNADMMGPLRELGFTDLRPLAPWSSTVVGDQTITALPYFGEGFGPECPRDWMCWHVATPGGSVVGLVDACRDDFGTMDDVMPEVRRRLGPVDILFAPASGFQYPVNHFTRRPFFLEDRFEPFTGGPDDALRWAAQVEAATLVPYALFHTRPDDVDTDDDAAASDPMRQGSLSALLQAAPDPERVQILRPGEVVRWT
jgi:L-ascorbate metabolism protein UlaG (beta-lactamase superfamily)